MVLHPSCTSPMPFTAISIASAAAVVHSQGSRSPCSGTAGFGPNTVFTSVTSKIGREQGPIRISQGCERGKECHRWTSVTSDGEWGPPWSCFPWEMQSQAKSVSSLSRFAKNIYFPLLLTISREKLQVAEPPPKLKISLFTDHSDGSYLISQCLLPALFPLFPL